MLSKEAAIVAYLRRPESVAQIERVAPGLAQAIISDAIDYIQDRRNLDQWINLQACEPQSILDSVRKLAALGLSVSTDLGSGFLVPRRDRNVPGGLICTAVPGVRGYEDVILRNLTTAQIETNVIRSQDDYEIEEGSDGFVKFRRNFRYDPAKPNPIIAAYCVIKENANGGRRQIRTVGISESTRILDKGTARERTLISFKTHDGREVEPGRMGAETACRYVAQRACMREVARTWLRGNKAVQGLVQLEDEHFRTGDEVPGADKRLTRRAGEKAKLQIVSPKTAPTPGSPGEEIPVEPAEAAVPAAIGSGV
jgi:hypothetical protein